MCLQVFFVDLGRIIWLKVILKGWNQQH